MYNNVPLVGCRIEKKSQFIWFIFFYIILNFYGRSFFVFWVRRAALNWNEMFSF